MVFNRFALFLALLLAALSSQLPEFAQQFRQRLGGAIDELNHIIADFDADAARRGMDRADGIASLEANEDPFVRGRGVQMRAIASRRDKLVQQLHDLETRQPIGEFLALGENFDTGVAANVLSDFEPAVPVALDGLVSALLGFVAGLAAIHLCAWPVRRHLRRRKTHIKRDPAVPA